MAWYDLHEARKAFGEFHFYFLKNSVFIQEKLKAKFSEFDALLHEVLVEREISLQHRDAGLGFKKGMELHQEGRKKLSALEVEVQKRLWSSMPNDG